MPNLLAKLPTPFPWPRIMAGEDDAPEVREQARQWAREARENADDVQADLNYAVLWLKEERERRAKRQAAMVRLITDSVNGGNPN